MRSDIPVSTPADIALVRARVRQMVPEGLRDDAALIASELATNALRWADTAMCGIAVTPDGEVTLTLEDTSSRQLHPGPFDVPGVDAESGRGLFLVEAVAREWGCDAHDGGKLVWATLAPCEPDAPGPIPEQDWARPRLAGAANGSELP
ncbi:ATP-binding protein [Streptomyces sp. ODS28]|uniref:ATP-binding protein n=1 Tax=Streptomyces sp. ODS28 TaxID=3136688 RepID=UPI0031EF4A83